MDKRRNPETAYAGGKGMPLKQMAKTLTRSEESIKDRAKVDGLKIAKLR